MQDVFNVFCCQNIMYSYSDVPPIINATHHPHMFFSI